MINPDFDPNIIATPIEGLAFMARRCIEPLDVNVSSYGIYLGCSDEMRAVPGLHINLKKLTEDVPAAFYPITVSTDKKSPSGTHVTVGGIPVDMQKAGNLKALLSDLEFINGITSELPGGDDDAYTVGRSGKMNGADKSRSCAAPMSMSWP